MPENEVGGALLILLLMGSYLVVSRVGIRYLSDSWLDPSETDLDPSGNHVYQSESWLDPSEKRVGQSVSRLAPSGKRECLSDSWLDPSGNREYPSDSWLDLSGNRKDPSDSLDSNKTPTDGSDKPGLPPSLTHYLVVHKL